MNWIKQYKNLNAKQKRDLHNKLSIIYNNIGFQMLVAGVFLYGIFWAFDLIDG